MDIEHYREIIYQLMNEYAGYKPSHGNIDTELIIDADKNHYELMHVGWDGCRRVHGSVVHIDIIADKIWIQLVRAGIPKNVIVLGFHPDNVRQYTGFAIR